jgi:acetate kinase
MMVLVLNCGSSSVKFQLVEASAAGVTRRRARGLVERIGGASIATFEADDGPSHRSTGRVPDHEAAVRHAVEWIRQAEASVEAVGHRVVHGGGRFTEPVVVDRAVERAIEELEALAPLHNAPSLAGIRAARATVGAGVPMVAVFDTAFHAALPEAAARYAIPHELAERHSIRRYGFHGTSYRWVVERYGELTGTPPDRATLVALHLGNGCSAAAIRGGRSIDTSMGFTPLEGLVMGTRAGDLDPALVGHLARRESVDVGEVERWLNERSGLLGVSGRSRDMRELLAAEGDDPRARLAVEMFCYRARKYVGAYLAALGGADGVVFTGGIGEQAPEVRARICAGMAWCGLALDPVRNAAAVGREAPIGADGARMAAWVVPTDEERIIARDTVARLRGPA